MNYYQKNIHKIEDLKYFPFSTFEEFERAVENGKVKDIGIAMDIARQWVMQTTKSTPFQRNSRIILSFLPFIIIIIYLISAFIIPNYWLIPYALLPLIIWFTGSPIARKVIPLHFIILGLFLLIWAFTGNLPAIYWVPIVAEYLVLDYFYKGSSQIVRKMLTEDEETLCYFWKWKHMNLHLKDGENYCQDFIKINGQLFYYEDIEKEWKDYINKQAKK